MRNRFIQLSLIALLGVSCDNFLGEKTDLSFIDKPVFQNRSIAYVPIQPALTDFLMPSDIIVGFDQLIYVVDELAEELVCMDVAGKVLGRLSVPGAKKIAQDRALDLLVIGTLDTAVAGSDYTLSTIYRIGLKNAVYGLTGATITNKIVHPFYFKTTFTATDADVVLTGIGVLGDNSFYVSRSGNRNSVAQFGGPENAILLFNNEDKYVTPIQVTTDLGVFSDYFKKPSSVSTFIQPPQTFTLNTNRNFVYAALDNNSALQVQMINYFESDFGSSYQVEYLPPGDTANADAFLYTPNRFSNPVDITVTGDGTNFIFVVDDVTDSLYQFTIKGLEGIKPPAASSNQKHVIVSFGGTGTELTQFNKPSAVAYYDKILYVADAGNARVLRFKLTTDFD